MREPTAKPVLCVLPSLWFWLRGPVPARVRARARARAATGAGLSDGGKEPADGDAFKVCCGGVVRCRCTLPCVPQFIA